MKLMAIKHSWAVCLEMRKDGCISAQLSYKVSKTSKHVGLA